MSDRVVGFTGTNTGRVYEVGKTYSNGNGSYMALSNGQFVNTKTGKATVGSSESPSAKFFVSQAAPSLSNGGGGSSSRVVTRQGAAAAKPSSVGTGPGTGGVGGGPDLLAGHPGGVTGMGHNYTFGKNQDGTFNASQLRFEVQPNVYLDTTAVWIGGQMAPIDVSSSSVQDYQSRYGDDNIVISTAGAVIVGGMDAGDAINGSWDLGNINQFLNNAAQAATNERDRARAPVKLTIDTPEFKRPSWPN